MKNNTLALIICSLFFTYATAQSLEETSIDSTKIVAKYNFFNHHYKHLTEANKIKISDSEFQNIIGKHKFYVKPNYTHLDSLQIVLNDEFKSPIFVRIGLLRLSYTWDRLRLFTRENEDNLKRIAQENKINHPYRFKQELEKDSITIPSIQAIVTKLRLLLSTEYGVQQGDKLSNNEVLNISFKNNPEVHKLKKAVFDKNNIAKFIAKHKKEPTGEELKKIGLECGKENCCQKN